MPKQENLYRLRDHVIEPVSDYIRAVAPITDMNAFLWWDPPFNEVYQAPLGGVLDHLADRVEALPRELLDALSLPPHLDEAANDAEFVKGFARALLAGLDKDAASADAEVARFAKDALLNAIDKLKAAAGKENTLQSLMQDPAPLTSGKDSEPINAVRRLQGAGIALPLPSHPINDDQIKWLNAFLAEFGDKNIAWYMTSDRSELKHDPDRFKDGRYILEAMRAYQLIIMNECQQGYKCYDMTVCDETSDKDDTCIFNGDTCASCVTELQFRPPEYYAWSKIKRIDGLRAQGVLATGPNKYVAVATAGALKDCLFANAQTPAGNGEFVFQNRGPIDRMAIYAAGNKKYCTYKPRPDTYTPHIHASCRMTNHDTGDGVFRFKSDRVTLYVTIGGKIFVFVGMMGQAKSLYNGYWLRADPAIADTPIVADAGDPRCDEPHCTDRPKDRNTWFFIHNL